MQVTQSISIAANATDQNILQTLGLRIREVLGFPGQIFTLTLLATGSAAGLEHSFFVGQDNPMETSAVNANNRIPIVPDDAVMTDVEAMSGEQLQLQVTNTTAGALTYNFTLAVEPVSA